MTKSPALAVAVYKCPFFLPYGTYESRRGSPYHVFTWRVREGSEPPGSGTSFENHASFTTIRPGSICCGDSVSSFANDAIGKAKSEYSFFPWPSLSPLEL